MMQQRGNDGTLKWAPVAATLYGLPVVGFTLSQSTYQTGSPQQNFGDTTPVRTTSKVVTTPQ